VINGENAAHAYCFTVQKVDCQVAFLQKMPKKRETEMLISLLKTLAFR